MSRTAVLAVMMVILYAVMSPAASSRAETSYTPVFKPFQGRDGVRIAIRELKDGRTTRYLAIDPYTFEPSLVDSIGAKTADGRWRESPYARALEAYSRPGAGLQNSGLRRGPEGLFLTVDLCPSERPMDTELFESTMGLPAYRDLPVPVAIAVSGLWMERHGDDMEWVLEKVRANRLKVTWVNHSSTHPYDRGRPLGENFLLKPGVEFDREVLDEEMALIRRGLLPSPFFRFPGLVANETLLARLKALSLVAIGADAWLAKGEVPREGSVILVHGNGNEPEGVRMLKELYRDAGGREVLRLLPLSEAFR